MMSQMMAPFKAVPDEKVENLPKIIMSDAKEYLAVDTSYAPLKKTE